MIIVKIYDLFQILRILKVFTAIIVIMIFIIIIYTFLLQLVYQSVNTCHPDCVKDEYHSI